jgi:hypothetical protein
MRYLDAFLIAMAVAGLGLRQRPVLRLVGGAADPAASSATGAPARKQSQR